MKPVLPVLLLTVLTAAALGLLSTALSGAQAPQNISAVLIIDNSGSMAATDPAGLRFVAASQLVDLLEDGDEISVVLFGDDSSLLVPLTNVTDEASKEAIKGELTPVAPAGNTNMRAGLESALAELEKGSNSIRFGIFLTDGELHPPGWPDFSEQEQEAERSAVFSLADRFGERDWGLFPISLASAVDPEFLQRLAENGGGLYREAPGAAELPLVFQEVFAASKLDVFQVLLSDCLAPGEQSSVTFPVHQFVSTLSLFVTYVTDLQPTVTVTGPDGEPVSPTGGDGRYDAYTIEDPARGTWTVTIIGPPEGESCLSISSTPRTLVDVVWLRPPPSLSLAPGEPLEINVRLTALDPQSGDERPVTEAVVNVTVTGPGGQSYEKALIHTGSGEYTGAVTIDLAEGTYSISLVVETEEGEVARRSFETTVSPMPGAAPSPSPTATPSIAPPPSQPGDDGRTALAFISLGAVVLAGLVASFLAYSHFGRPILQGWLVAPRAGRAYALESRHRRTWMRRPLTIGGPKDDMDLGLDKRAARVVARRGGRCLLQAVSKVDVVVDGYELKRGQRRRVRDGSEISLGGVRLVYRRQMGGPRIKA